MPKEERPLKNVRQLGELAAAKNVESLVQELFQTRERLWFVVGMIDGLAARNPECKWSATKARKLVLQEDDDEDLPTGE